MSEISIEKTKLDSKSDSFEKLEKEITQIVSNCRSLLSYKNPLSEEDSCRKNNGSNISTIPESKSSLAIEKVSNCY